MSEIKFKIGNKLIGDKSILIQSMSNIKTSEIKKNISLTNRLEKMGLDMMRFSILDSDDLSAINSIKSKINVPLILDIHYSYKLAMKALDTNLDKIRINPGNMVNLNELEEVIKKAKDKDVAIRLGINYGSFRKELRKNLDDFYLYIDKIISIFSKLNFEKLVLSFKSSDINETINLYKRASKLYKYPLHIGLTESGLLINGTVKSTIALFQLLKENIGDTIRVSLNSNKEDEIRVCKQLLKETNKRNDIPSLIVCPSCGRTKIELSNIANIIQKKLDTTFKPIKVALMGCPVNGIKEGEDSDIGLSGDGSSNGYIIFKKGRILGHYSKNEAINILISLIDEY